MPVSLRSTHGGDLAARRPRLPAAGPTAVPARPKAATGDFPRRRELPAAPAEAETAGAALTSRRSPASTARQPDRASDSGEREVLSSDQRKANIEARLHLPLRCHCPAPTFDLNGK